MTTDRLPRDLIDINQITSYSIIIERGGSRAGSAGFAQR